MMMKQLSDRLKGRRRYRQMGITGAWKSHYGGGAFGPWGRGKLRKTVVYHDGRDAPLGKGVCSGQREPGWGQPIPPLPNRSVKSGNAEDQQARIASALDRLAELVGLAMGPMDHSEMPKGWSPMAGFVPALRQRLRPRGEVRL